MKRVEKLESLKKLFEEVAVQSHAPLALVNTWVQHLKRCPTADATAEWATKVLGQLKKLEISYDRMALCVDAGRVLSQSEKQPLDLGIELKRTVEEFPASEAQRICVQVPNELKNISGNPVEISFIYSSILAYLLRCVAGSDPIHAHVIAEADSTILVRFSAAVATQEGKSGSGLARAKFDLALGDSTIKAFASNNSAVYQRNSSEKEATMELRFAVTE
jgi:hypothetical protein